MLPLSERTGCGGTPKCAAIGWFVMHVEIRRLDHSVVSAKLSIAACNTPVVKSVRSTDMVLPGVDHFINGPQLIGEVCVGKPSCVANCVAKRPDTGLSRGKGKLVRDSVGHGYSRS